jgi:hypothetical protein
MVHAALDQLGDDATADQIIRFVRNRFAAVLEARFLPIYRATLRGEDQMRAARARAAELTETG